jgi:hypothetical protein
VDPIVALHDIILFLLVFVSDVSIDTTIAQKVLGSSFTSALETLFYRKIVVAKHASSHVYDLHHLPQLLDLPAALHLLSHGLQTCLRRCELAEVSV